MAVLTLLTLSHQRRYHRHFGRLRLIVIRIYDSIIIIFFIIITISYIVRSRIITANGAPALTHSLPLSIFEHLRAQTMDGGESGNPDLKIAQIQILIKDKYALPIPRLWLQCLQIVIMIFVLLRIKRILRAGRRQSTIRILRDFQIMASTVGEEGVLK